MYSSGFFLVIFDRYRCMACSHTVVFQIFLTFCQVRLTSVIWSVKNLLKKTNRGGLTKPTVVSVIGCSNPQVYGQTIRRWRKQLFVVAVAVPGLVKTTPFKRLRAKTGQYLT